MSESVIWLLWQTGSRPTNPIDDSQYHQDGAKRALGSLNSVLFTGHHYIAHCFPSAEVTGVEKLIRVDAWLRRGLMPRVT